MGSVLLSTNKISKTTEAGTIVGRILTKATECQNGSTMVVQINLMTTKEERIRAYTLQVASKLKSKKEIITERIINHVNYQVTN